MAAAPAGMGLGSALKGAGSQAAPALLSGLGQGAGSALAGGGNQASQPIPVPSLPQAQSFQIQPVVSSGSSAAPLNFSGGMATPSNSMNPQILRLIQMLSAIRGG